jgi:hypothetical protein
MSTDTDPNRFAAAEAAPHPGELGGGGLAPISDAPGIYVYDH